MFQTPTNMPQYQGAMGLAGLAATLGAGIGDPNAWHRQVAPGIAGLAFQQAQNAALSQALAGGQAQANFSGSAQGTPTDASGNPVAGQIAAVRDPGLANEAGNLDRAAGQGFTAAGTQLAPNQTGQMSSVPGMNIGMNPMQMMMIQALGGMGGMGTSAPFQLPQGL